MKVLVVDDDRTTRFLLRRALVTEFGCTVAEARDGIEALDALAKSAYQLVILDVQMPVMDGLETLRALRDAPGFKTLPVVMLTAERNEAIVQQIVGLGVLDYMTKPLVSLRVVERLRRVVRWLDVESDGAPERAAAGGRDAIEQAASLLVVDGSEAFRRFVAETLGRRRTVLQAETGARGFRVCLEANPAVVFVGSDLGVLNPELLARKIRSTASLRETYLVAVVDREEERAARAAFSDGTLVRTLVPEAFLKQIESLSRTGSGGLQELLERHPGLQASLVSAGEQVFGMMLSADVLVRDAPLPAAGRVTVSARASWGTESAARLRACCDEASGRRIAAHLLGLDPSMVGPEDVSEAVSEVFHAVGGRLCSVLAAKQVPMQLEHAAVSRASNAEDERTDGRLVVCLQSTPGDVSIWVTLEGAAAGDEGRRTDDARDQNPRFTPA